jgi:methylmalonyl-CoA mutase N-terminal domain/subunit
MDEPRRKPAASAGAIPIKPVYGPDDIAAMDYRRDLGDPGQYPFTRGIAPGMYRDRIWHIAQYAGFGSGDDANARLRYLLDIGQSMIIVALDLPTQIGYDPDHSLAEGEVGRVGVSIVSLADMERLFDGISLTRARMCMVANAIGPLALSWFLALTERQGLAPDQVVVNLQNDPFKEFTGRGTYNVPPKAAIKLAADVVEYTAKHLPTWEPQNVCGSHLRWGGASTAQEIAFAIANSCAYMDELVARGLPVDSFAYKLELHLNAGHEFLEEVAKFRAARRVWARVLRERYGAQEDRSLAVRISVYTAGYTLTAQQPLNNITRITLQALAAALGGVQYINTGSYDEALEIPSKDAATLSTRTQQILAFESGVTDTADPLGGSYFIESLTNEFDCEISNILKEVDGLGGALSALERGYYDRHLTEGAYRYQRDVESGAIPIVGLNCFADPGDRSAEGVRLWEPDPTVEERSRAAVRELRERRDAAAVATSLRRLEQECRAGTNVVPAVLEAVKAYATTGEVCDVWRGVYGEYRQRARVI